MIYQIGLNQSYNGEAAVMGKLKSHIPELLKQKGWSVKRFVAQCMLADLGQDTAYRLARGETNVKSDTLRVVAQILCVTSISDLIDIEPDEQ